MYDVTYRDLLNPEHSLSSSRLYIFIGVYALEKNSSNLHS